MNQTFFEGSVNFAERFIRTILFIDDQIKWEEETDRHDLNALQLTKTFANKKTSCAFFLFKEKEEQSNILKIIPNCDSIILDWRIHIEEELPSEEEEEEDIESSEVRGKYALKLLKEIVFSEEIYSPKSIIILTGETNGGQIFDALKKEFPQFEPNSEELFLTNRTFRISIYFKPTLAEHHLPNNVKSKTIRSYGELPKITATEFAQLSSGLISNVVLESISVLRDNTSRLLQSYRSELDSAFLAHRAMLPVPEDAEELLEDTLIGSINAILSYSDITRSINIETIEKWIEAQKYEEKEITILKKANKVTITNEERAEWQRKGYKEFIPYVLEKNNKAQLTDDQFETYERHGNLLKDVLENFITNVDNQINEEFAILTHHKSNLLQPSYTPQLILGVVIKAMPEEYLLCIQQRCDSVRVGENESRRFLFLPLEETEKNFRIIYKDKSDKYIKLRVKNKNCFDLKTISFKQTNNGIVSAQNEEEKLIFEDAEGNKFEWILDLKEAHAQKIVNEFSANLSRVGLDESEWLRRS